MSRWIDVRNWFDFLVEATIITPDKPATGIRKYGFLRNIHPTPAETVIGDVAHTQLAEAENAESVVPHPGGPHPDITSHGATATLCEPWALISDVVINVERVAPQPDATDQTARLASSPEDHLRLD